MNEPNVIIADRSTLQRFAECPRQGVLIARGGINSHSDAANSGSYGFHEAASRVIAQYIDMGGHPGTGVGELVNMMCTELAKSRPDVQADAIEGGRRSVWDFAKLIQPLAVSDILGFDGGVGGKCSQLAADIELGDTVVRVTGEMDLLLANEASPEIVDLYDWKTGRGTYDEGDVFGSFQFRCYAWLVFQAYDVATVRVQVWNTRIGSKTRWVYFHRERDERNLYWHIRNAAEMYARYRESDVAPPWPSKEKCMLCDACLACDRAGMVATTVNSDPGSVVDYLAAAQARLDKLTEELKSYVDKHGDIVSDSGNAFGRNKPKSERKAPAGMYECAPPVETKTKKQVKENVGF